MVFCNSMSIRFVGRDLPSENDEHPKALNFLFSDLSHDPQTDTYLEHVHIPDGMVDPIQAVNADGRDP
nr:hypothetical protein Iba_chr14bCG15550 [Ipomoea batatas]